MRLDRPLQVGASGGHGPIRYTVESYEPGRAVNFRFLAPKGFVGTHGFSLARVSGGVSLSHTLSITAAGMASMSWAFVFRPLHDALIEDALSNAERVLTGSTTPVPWSIYVRLLRFVARHRK